jgi:uncharacterized protein (DUF952 family)
MIYSGADAGIEAGPSGGAAAMDLVYKIAPGALWREAEETGLFTGAPVDLADGFIHFSTAEQAQETAARHFRGQAGLLLIAVEAERLGPALRFEPSRGGALFPHLHASLSLGAVRWIAPLALDGDGVPDVHARLGEFAR